MTPEVTRNPCAHNTTKFGDDRLSGYHFGIPGTPSYDYIYIYILAIFSNTFETNIVILYEKNNYFKFYAIFRWYSVPYELTISSIIHDTNRTIGIYNGIGHFISSFQEMENMFLNLVVRCLLAFSHTDCCLSQHLEYLP